MYQLANEKKDAGFYNQANEARSRVEVARITAMDESSKFGEKIQEKIDSVVGKVSRILERYPSFPDTLSRFANEEALPNFIQRIQNTMPPPFPDPNQLQFPLQIPRQMLAQPVAISAPDQNPKSGAKPKHRSQALVIREWPQLDGKNLPLPKTMAP